MTYVMIFRSLLNKYPVTEFNSGQNWWVIFHINAFFSPLQVIIIIFFPKRPWIAYVPKKRSKRNMINSALYCLLLLFKFLPEQNRLNTESDVGVTNRNNLKRETNWAFP